MVNTAIDENNIFRVVDQIQLAYTHIQEFEYFGLQVIGNLN